MAITTRQTSLLVAEDWTKIYQTFRNADFQSYDYETLRKSMIDYLRLYYPEDFNDFTESSEFIALIDLIAFMGQSLAFRTDLNARENFIDTAQRRDSVFKLARLISYVPKRNIASSGYLKIDGISTTESVYDSNGLNLAGLVISWADSGNDNWLEQFTTILNASLSSSQTVGKPGNSQLINGITTSEYQINLVANIIATYRYRAAIEGTQTTFEVVSPTSAGQTYVYEANPRPNSSFNVLYRNDNLGNASANTGFFLYFKQGELQSIDFNFAESIPNRVHSINTNNINNTDVWLYSLDTNGQPSTEWVPVPAVGVSNVIYNKQSNKNIYQVNTRAGDQIDLIFGDGSFANIPQGNYRLYYRTSTGANYKITPDEMQHVVIPINYTSRSGRIETINITASLQYTVANASPRETIEEIRQKAPQQYYTRDRMVTGEDYNILPYTLFSNVLKAKAVNRTSSGVSRYLDVIDTTGKYSSTNIFAEDGILYRDETQNTFSFEFVTRNDIYRTIYNNVVPLVTSQEMLHYFYAFYFRAPLVLPDVRWQHSTVAANSSTGYFVNSLDKILQVGDIVSNNNSYIKPGSIIKFSAGAGNYFDARNNIQLGVPSKTGDKKELYVVVDTVLADGTNAGQGNLSNGTGPITLGGNVPSGAIAVSVYAVFNNSFSTAVVESMVAYTLAYEDFGIRYDIATSSWVLIKPQDLSTAAFNLQYAGNTSGTGLDSSWMIYFKTIGQTYTVTYRGLDYVFESELETNFYFDNTVKIYDPKTGITLHDQIKVLKINSNPDDTTPQALDYIWYIHKNIIDVDGYSNPNRILVTFPDANNDGIPDNPELFDLIVSPYTFTESKYVYFKATAGYDNFTNQLPVSNATIISTYGTALEIESDKTLYQAGQLFYVPSTNTYYELSISGAVYTLNVITGYTSKIGRQNIYFQYRHNSPNYRRIDPSPNNIIDLYMLTKQFAADYTSWIKDSSGTVIEPTRPSSAELGAEFASLEKYKSVSDTIIYNPAKFKPVFGAKAPVALQATFKVVKNSAVIVSDNDIKTSVITAINDYFDVSNWDFGETFYFSELSAYLHSVLAPNIASITIVPSNESSPFGSLLQINAEYNEIITSAATVDNIQVISAITAAQINQIVLA
jgi:hypothetical protein